ncbi:MAG: hypothetical protein AAGI01_08170 [Myxococcota bacterium]
MSEDDRAAQYATTDKQRRRNWITVLVILAVVGFFIASGVLITLRNAAAM